MQKMKFESILTAVVYTISFIHYSLIQFVLYSILVYSVQFYISILFAVILPKKYHINIMPSSMKFYNFYFIFMGLLFLFCCYNLN